MAFFMVSDIIITATLLINAIALMSTKFHYDDEEMEEEVEQSREKDEGMKNIATAGIAVGSGGELMHEGANSPDETQRLLAESTSDTTRIEMKTVETAALKRTSTASSASDVATSTENVAGNTKRASRTMDTAKTAVVRIHAMQNAVRRLSGVIVLWNVFFIILMVFVFRG